MYILKGTAYSFIYRVEIGETGASCNGFLSSHVMLLSRTIKTTRMSYYRARLMKI